MGAPGFLRKAFPDGRFQPPATPDEIGWAEGELGVALPPALRLLYLYLQSNGFCESKGNAQCLAPLEELVRNARFLWCELAESLEGVDLPDFTPFVFFGRSSADYWWGVRVGPPHDIIAWHHHMIDEGGYERLGSDVISVYRADFAMYGGLD